MQSLACVPESAHAPSVALNTKTFINPVLRAFRGFVAPPHGLRRSRGVRGSGAAAALKLDTRILEGNPQTLLLRPAIVPYDDPAYRGRSINYPIYEKAVHFRAKVQEFTHGGFEVVLTSINLQRCSDLAAAHLPRGKRTERKGDQESIEKARRRAKRLVRLKCKEMAADHLVTFTTRKTISRDELKGAWGRFTDNVTYHMKRKFDYVCVVERHPTNPDHLHLHAAIRGRLSAREMVIFRRCWYISLGGQGNAKGADVPGGFNIRKIKAKGGSLRMMDKIASYISKYITKDDCNLFNKKRYWSSKIDLKEARSYWLKAQTIGEALTEFCKDFDYWPTDLRQDFFQARNLDLIWLRYIPDDTQAPPRCPF